ncbi:Xaa-Pro peptidase family protein [Streptacidiphilus sp. P02-A3a]|uniref:M24 family metallopeptidase n=1 Tax=Streptacidiphilus sp. P02-A3a TaxID=2704468 RepID=UPI0015FE2DF1|nr:aminopeptidase P family protein [Streptacidiphilus sp. P02-A3a]QMU69226.1 M24 family metallopeptidase [Streptacidiphilus sp. P02-A3a]
MAEVHRERRERLRAGCLASGIDAALVTRPVNIRWLTGADAVRALLVDGDRVTAVAAAGYRPEQGVTLLPAAPGADPAALLAADCHASPLGFEEHDLTVARYRTVAAASDARLVDLDRAVERLRTVKDEEEISFLRIAAEIADQALGELLESILVGRTERHLAMELERRMVDHGADGPAYPVRVGAGEHSGLAGHPAGDRRVEDGDFVTVSIGGCYRGYRSSATRTFVVGLAPADWQVELHRQVFEAQRAARESLVADAAPDAAELAARRVLAAAGHPGEVLGQGIGLEIAEAPRLGPQELGKLDNRVPVTVAVGVHLPGRGGVRIEDTLVVRPSQDGGPELLTITTKELLAL